VRRPYGDARRLMVPHVVCVVEMQLSFNLILIYTNMVISNKMHEVLSHVDSRLISERAISCRAV